MGQRVRRRRDRDNTGDGPIDGWTLTWAFPGSQQVTHGWNADLTHNAANVTAQNASWNGTVPPAGTVSFRFMGSYSQDNPAPASFELNGQPCD